jgi:hypothetical protein
MIHTLLHQRESCFTCPRCFGGCVGYGMVGIAAIVVSEVLDGQLLPNWAWLIGLFLIATFVLAWTWPSYRIAGCAVTVFLWGGLLCSVTPLLHYYGLEILLEAIPRMVVVHFVALIWMSACVTIARLRLPIVYPPGHCQACGYDLRGLEQNHPRCPECGESIVLPKRYPRD